MKLKHLILLSVICCSQSVFGQKPINNRRRVAILYSRDGMPIRKELYLEMNTGFILRIRHLMTNRPFMDAFSSKDLVNWTKHPKVISKENISWFKRALWAPAVIHANDKYYIFFGANDIQSNNELGGIGVAVADNPAGPFKDALGKPLIDKFVNGAQPIDQFVYKRR